MILNWLRRRRRTAIRSKPFPEEWAAILSSNLWHYDRLADAQRTKLNHDTQVLVAEKNWEGCGGLDLTDEHRVTVAGTAALLTLGLENQYFDKVQSVLIYPGAYVAPDNDAAESGMIVFEGGEAREGEAWYRGPVVLSWNEVLAGGRRQDNGSNVVLHEFAHQLDMLNGREVDGMPELSRREEVHRWQTVMRTAYERLIHDCRRRARTVIDCYGAQDPAEFFAVATEAFFERAPALRDHHPELYQLFSNYFQQDPATREP